MHRQQAIWALALIALSVILPSACSNIDESERLTVINVVEKDTIPMPNSIPSDTTDTIVPFDPFTPQGRHVLIEDFTGQECVNCPNATILIEQLQEMYGHDCIIAVGIHSGPLGVKPSKNPQGLASDLGDTYYDYWKIEMQPYGVIDRSDGPLSTDWWTAKVNWDLSPEQPDPSVNVWVDARIADNRKADISVTIASFEYCNANLQLWLVEDSIVAFQKMPDGTTKQDYVHNHVLRDAVNGAWGDEFTMEATDVREFSYSYSIPTGWNIANMYVVAFAYTDAKVVQAVRVRIED